MDRIVGIALQTFLWICLSWLYFSKLTFSDTEKIIALIIFVIGIFIYFFEMMLNSKTFHFISQSRIIIKNKKELLSMITKAKLSVEILTKAFHYKDRKEVVSRSEIINYEFENVQDLSDFNSVDNMIDEMKNKLIIIDLDLRVIYSEGSNFKELDKCVESIKNSIKSKDKYFEVQTGYVLENLKKRENVFILEDGVSLLFSPYIYIFMYLILVGEFYKILVDNNITFMNYSLIKVINKFVPSSRKDNVLCNNASFFDNEDDHINLLYGFNNNNKCKLLDESADKINVENELSTNKFANANNKYSVKNDNHQHIKDNYIIDNYDPIFDARPINSLDSNNILYTNFQETVGSINKEEVDNKVKSSSKNPNFAQIYKKPTDVSKANLKSQESTESYGKANISDDKPDSKIGKQNTSQEQSFEDENDDEDFSGIEADFMGEIFDNHNKKKMSKIKKSVNQMSLKELEKEKEKQHEKKMKKLLKEQLIKKSGK